MTLRCRRRTVRLSAIALALAALSPALAGEMTIVSISPPARSLVAPIDTTIGVRFGQAVNPATVTHSSIRAFGRWSGPVGGTFSFSPDGATVTLTPDRVLSSGEQVMVILSHDLAALDGSPFRSAGWSWQFWTRSRATELDYTNIDTFSTRTVPNQTVRSYGGVGTDLDNDGWLDLTIVNEDVDDLRVFLNNADGSGLFGDYLEPPTGIGNIPSPNEPADFDNDGNADMAVVNPSGDSVSIVLGNGDGTFQPQQEIAVGAQPRGIAVLDADGDGDPDVACTNHSSNNLSLLLNNGSGVFGAPSFFQGGVNGEWALAAADMDEDGILDLVVGGRSSAQMSVMRGNGNGTFTFVHAVPSGGLVWMIAVGDVNGDGHDDVAGGNSGSNNGSIILGNGDGTLDPPVTYPTDPFALATDLGDMDGDGDLDWTISSFGGDWWLFTNNGAGAFAFDQEFNAPSAGSCALAMDIDNDGDLDLALVDEIADVVVLMKSGPPSCPADINGDGNVGFFDLTAVLTRWGACAPGTCLWDLDGTGDVGFGDLTALLLAWGPC